MLFSKKKKINIVNYIVYLISGRAVGTIITDVTLTVLHLCP